MSKILRVDSGLPFFILSAIWVLFIGYWIGVQMKRTADAIVDSETTRVNRMETGWESPPLHHNLTTFQRLNEDVKPWVHRHVDTLNECFEAFEGKQ